MSKLIVSRFNGQDGNPGDLIRVSDKTPTWGSLMVINATPALNANGIFSVNKRIGFVRALITDLEALQVEDGTDLNKTFAALGIHSHRIQVVESTTPMYEGQKPKINPETKEIIVNVEGEAIYYDTRVSPDTIENIDIRIPSAKLVANIIANSNALPTTPQTPEAATNAPTPDANAPIPEANVPTT